MTELKKALEQLQLFLKETGYEEAESLMTMSEEELDELFRRFKRDVRKKERAYSPNSDEYKRLNEQRALVERIEKMLRDREKENSGLMLSGVAKEDGMNSKTEEFDAAKEEKDADNTQSVNAGKTAEAAKERIFEEYESEQLRKYKAATDLRTKQALYCEAVKRAKEDPAYFCLIARFEEADQKNRERVMRLYDNVARNGNGKVAWEAANRSKEGKLFPKDMERIYKEIAIENGCLEAILEKAFESALWKEKRENGETVLGDFRDLEEAFGLFTKYVKTRGDIDLKNDNDRMAVFHYYKLGMDNGQDMLKKSVTIPLRELIENEGTYTRDAQCLEGRIYARAGRYDEAIQLLLNAGTKAATREVEQIFMSDDYNQRPKEQEILDNHLESMLYSEDTVEEVREELFRWYGMRYAEGRKMICDKAIAYAHYGKAASIGGWENYENKKREILGKLSRNEKIVLLEKVLDYEFKDGSHCTDVYLELAELYEAKSMYEKAREIYSEGSRYATDPKVREQCRKEYKKCDDRFTKRQLYIQEAEESYNQCNTGLVGQKQGGFERLREMAKRGNTYAALRFAQVAEQDSYLKDTMKNNFPTSGEIFNCYKKAAGAGEKEAISRMVDIFRYGQLGQSKDSVAAERWREKL